MRRAIEKEIIVLESGLDNQGDSGRSTVTGSFLAGIRKGQSGQQLADKRFVSAKPTCVYCKGLHSSAQCNVVVDVKARLEVVKRERLCFNCLGSHRAMNCNSKNRCRLCHKKHHTTLCGMDNPLISGATTVRQQNATSQPPQTSQVSPPLTNQAPQGSLNPASNSFVPTQQHISEYTMATQPLLVVKCNPQCLLKTAIALVRVGNKRISANVLFDEGAQRSFVTETLAAQPGASPHHKESLAISSFGGSTSLNNQVSLVNFILETTEGDIKISALVVPKIAAPIQNFVRSDLHNLPHLRGLTLAHPVSSAEKFEISLLIGVDYYWEIVGNHVVRGRGPTAMQSMLGYLLSGPLPIQSESIAGSLHSYTMQTSNIEVSDYPDSIMNDCSPPSPTPPPDTAGKPSESFLLTYQENYISRDTDGSYIVRFPWKENYPLLPSNLAICDRQTRALARRLSHQPGLLQLYGNIIADQQQRNFIEYAPSLSTKENHYIPHHPVRKNSPTTPIRIVYNCSCRQSPRHASLNDCLMVGDSALTDLCAVLLRFRLHCYALSTDIEKAFLHVKLDSQDRDFTRFLWLADPTNPESPFISYRFKVVLFGSVSSPFMLNATLDLHLKSFDSPVSHDMKKNLYVDNIISGCQSEEEILQYYTESRAIMSDAKFNLRSWASNSPKLQEQAQRDNTLDADTTVNVLGLKWNTCTDTLSFTMPNQSLPCDQAKCPASIVQTV